MKISKSSTVILGLLAFMILGIAAIKPPKDKYKNLKVLPKNISEATMDSVMEEFKHALGVGCDFCHVKSKKDTLEWDHASDEKPEKLIGRKMITMSNKINKDFFNATTKYGDQNMVLEIRCMTCHHGVPHPGMEEEEEEEVKKEENELKKQ